MTARELALAVVRDVFPPPGSGAIERTAQASLNYRAQRSVLSERDRAFAAELAYGAIKMRRALDWRLEPFLTHPDLPAVVREILRLAAYELIYTRAAEHATVFEFVNLAKRFSHRGLASLVNAVLRAFLRAKPGEPLRDTFSTQEDYLATRYSLPTWLVRQWRASLDGDLEAVCAAVNDPAQVAIVVNTLKASVDAVAAQLRSAGIDSRRSPYIAEALLLGRSAAAHTGGDGVWWTQSESSAMAVDVLGPQPDEAIIDVCSGRGNKALQIGARQAGQGELYCVEIVPGKAATLQRRLSEAGLSAAVISADATAEFLPRDRCFDRALVDAPCSGVGVVGRHPEARWKKQGSDGERLALTQRALLEATARHVYPGGALVYAVCSTDPRETTEVIDWFLAGQNFERGLIPSAYRPFMTAGGDVLVPPGLEGRDGFYIARVERRT